MAGIVEMIQSQAVHMRSYAIVAVLIIGLSACDWTHTGDPVLDCFPGVGACLSPESEIDLEEIGVFMPSSVLRYRNSLIIEKGQSDNVVDIYNFSTGEIIHCFRKGRGPGEVVMPSSLQAIADSLFLYDISRQRYYRLDLQHTISSGEEFTAEVNDFSRLDTTSFVRPFVMVRHNGGVFATGFFPYKCWFVGIDSDNKIVGGPGYLEYSAISEFPQESQATFHISSKFAISPDERRLICAHCYSAAFSICELKEYSANETFRYVSKREPLVFAPNSRSDPGISFAKNHSDGYIDVCADDEYIYLLYSGKPVSGDTPSYVSTHLLLYDWNGNPLKRIELDKGVQSISLDSGKLYCTTSFPDSRILIYDISLVVSGKNL